MSVISKHKCVNCGFINHRASQTCKMCRKKTHPAVHNPQSHNDILKKGILKKKGKGFFSGWSSRYFILTKNGTFTYFADRTYRDRRGDIDLRSVLNIQRKNHQNIILHTPQRKWYLYSHSKNELDHWQQLITSLSSQRPQIKQQHQRNKIHSAPLKSTLHINASNVSIPAFNPHFTQHQKQGNICEANPYLTKDIQFTEKECFEWGYLCTWRVTESLQETQKTLQVLMRIQNAEVTIFGGRKMKKTNEDPLDCAIRKFRIQTRGILDDTIYKSITETLSSHEDRRVFWSGARCKSVMYLYQMDYDYEMVRDMNDLYWIHWNDIYQYCILHSDQRRQPIIINKQKYEINDAVCRFFATEEIRSYFGDLMLHKTKHILPDPYSIASAPPEPLSPGNREEETHDPQDKAYKWQWFGAECFRDFDEKSNRKIEDSFLRNTTDSLYITINNTEYKIHLKDCTQTNTSTKRVRLLRRVSDDPAWRERNHANHSNKMVIFQYLNDNGEWSDYGKEISLQIQSAMCRASHYTFIDEKGDECEIDFKIMEQRNLSKHGLIRPIRRAIIA